MIVVFALVNSANTTKFVEIKLIFTNVNVNFFEVFIFSIKFVTLLLLL